MGMLGYLTPSGAVDDLEDRVATVHERSQLRVARNIDGLHEEIGSLRKDVEELALFTSALTTLLVDKVVITHAELADRVVEIDRVDGVEDGRLGGAASDDPS